MLLCRLAHHVDEKLMDPAIAREFRMEGSREQFALAHQHRVTISFGHYLNFRANPSYPGSSDINHLQRAAGQFGIPDPDGAVDLPPIGISFHTNVHDRQALLGRMGDIAGKQNAAGTSAEGRLLSHEALKGLEKAVPLQEF